ncbi:MULTISPECIES: hypothetical protein [Xanthomonas]|uniref:hypothetical protein n=1 Tax=Xanthomonas TaxID=338 RepID=UPI001E2E58B6|nr:MULTISPECIES: hypothetical protein [Xanthomonas]
MRVIRASFASHLEAGLGLASALSAAATPLRWPRLSRLTHAPAGRKASGACKATHLFHTPCGWTLHKAVDKCAQALACNAVKMGGEKMTNQLREAFVLRDHCDPGRIGKVVGAGVVAMVRPASSDARHAVNLEITSVVPTR